MPPGQLQTLRRAITVIDCFTPERTELGVREVARLVNLSSSAAGRLLAALKEEGVLSQNPNTRAYSMGSRVLRWADIYNSTLDIRNKAHAAIVELHQTTLETISLYILEGRERVCIERLESPHSVRIVQRIGRRLPLYAGSAGKAMLAFLSPARQEAVLQGSTLEPLTPKTIVDPAALRRELKKIRERGCAVSYGEWVIDAAGVSAPILNQDGEVIAAVVISGPTARFSKEKVNLYCDEIRRVAAQISESMGYRP